MSDSRTAIASLKMKEQTPESIQEIANQFTSHKQLMKHFGFPEGGSSYVSYKRVMNEIAVNTDHFTGRKNNSGRKAPVPHDLAIRTFREMGGNYRATAAYLGISRQSLYEIVRRFRIKSRHRQ